ncbi:MAG: hypothetical protein GXO12_03455 [Epsilonproteobacteria bacterium]|nr:hypothetical protein [Campylobacterota bacterium]
MFQKLQNKKILLVPATPLTTSFSKKLEEEGIDIIGFVDKNKTGKNIYRYEDISNIKFDLILIYNDIFFEEIYKSCLEKADKTKIYRVVGLDNGYKIVGYKDIKSWLKKQKLLHYRQKIFQNIQNLVSNLYDLFGLKRKNIVVLTKNYIGANSKYLFLFLRKNNHKVYLISNNKKAKELDINYLKFNSLKSYIVLSTVKIVITDEVIYEYLSSLSKNCKTIQLWHGVGIKRLNPVCNIKYDYFISTSNWTNETNFKNIFKVDKFLNCGYPRNDIFFRDLNEEDLGLCDINIFNLAKSKKTILYAPTYRDLLEDNIPPLDFAKFNEFLKKLNIYLIVKMHPFVSDMAKKYSNIIFFPSKDDVYPILKYTDILITDYSSILYDFLLLDRPIISFAYDLDKYGCTRDGFLFDYESFTPAKIVLTEDELKKEIKDLLNGDDLYKYKREEVLKKFFDYKDGKSSKRIEKLINKG